jgi:hypothetical protein
MTWRAVSAGTIDSDSRSVSEQARVPRRRRRHRRAQGTALQVEPMKSMLSATRTHLLKLKCDEPLSSFAFKFNLRRYMKADHFRIVLVTGSLDFIIAPLA